MYSETFRKLKLYESIYPGEFETVTKKELDKILLETDHRYDEKPFSDASAARTGGPLPKSRNSF